MPCGAVRCGRGRRRKLRCRRSCFAFLVPPSAPLQNCQHTFGDGRPLTATEKARAYYSRAAATYATGDYPEAFADLERCIQFDPRMPKAFGLLGDVALHHPEGSEEPDFRKALAAYDVAVSLGANEVRMAEVRVL